MLRQVFSSAAVRAVRSPIGVVEGPGWFIVNSKNDVLIEDMAKRLSGKAGISQPPVCYFSCPLIAGFAGRTGKNGKNAAPAQAIIALSTGARDKLSKQELEALVAHEIIHIKKGDVFVLSPKNAGRKLLEFCGYAAAYVLLSLGAAYLILKAIGKSIGFQDMALTTVVNAVLIRLAIPFEQTFLLGISRLYRRMTEFRADKHAAMLAGTVDGLISLLQRTNEEKGQRADPSAWPAQMPQTLQKILFKISSTHPPEEKRIERLEALRSQIPAAQPPEKPYIRVL